MTIRITPQTTLATALEQSQRINARLAELQQQASSGVRVRRPSDAPESIGEILTKKTDRARLEADIENIRSVTSKLNHSVAQLLDINKSLIRVKEIAIDAPQSQERELLSNEVNRILEQIVQFANGRNGDAYVFSGAATNRAPFEVVRDVNGRITGVRYQGGEIETRASIGDGASVSLNAVGSEVFERTDRAPTTLSGGNTGAVAGSGTDTATGTGRLQVTHVATSYDPASGVKAGLSSPGGDTIIGAAGIHRLTVIDTSGTGTAGTISLNGGDPVAFSATDTDLKVAGPGGAVVYVDTTAIAAGFSGDVDITATGVLSVDGGLTTVAISAGANQQVIDSRDGSVTWIDSTGIRSTGTERIEYPGTTGVFESLIQLRDDLLNPDGLSEAELSELFNRRLGDIDRVRDDLLATVGQQSVELENLQALQTHTEDIHLQTNQRISELESADITEVLLNLRAEENLLQFTYASILRVIDQSLLEFLR